MDKTDKKNMKRELKGRTPEQQKVIKYFYGVSGCLKKGMKDEEYESMVMARVKGTDFKQKALDKLGVDESQVNEVAPIHFEGYWLPDDEKDKNKVRVRQGKDKIRTSAYQISWIFFSSTQIYVYQYTFHMDEEGKRERTEEYFYKDVTNFSTVSSTVETKISKVNCRGNITDKRINVDKNEFAIIVPGDKFSCAMDQNEYTERVIQGMKAKLREKKG